MWGFYTCAIQELITGHMGTAASVLAKATTPAVTEVLIKLKLGRSKRRARAGERGGGLNALSRSDRLPCQDSHFRDMYALRNLIPL